jgi:hypothetical protein
MLHPVCFIDSNEVEFAPSSVISCYRADSSLRNGEASPICFDTEQTMCNNRGQEYKFKRRWHNKIVVTMFSNENFSRYEFPEEEAIEFYAQLLTRGFDRR